MDFDNAPDLIDDNFGSSDDLLSGGNYRQSMKKYLEKNIMDHIIQLLVH